MNNNVIKNIKDIDRGFIIKCINTLDDKPYQNETQFRDALVKKIREKVTKNIFVSIENPAYLKEEFKNKYVRKNINNKNVNGPKISKELYQKLQNKKGNNNRKNIDIAILDTISGDYIIIELKYTTKDKREIKDTTKSVTEFIYKDNKGKDVRIACQGANDNTRYRFLLDVLRLELISEGAIKLYKNHGEYENFVKGFAIIVTNDNLVVKMKNEDAKNAKDEKFSYAATCIGNEDWTQQTICFSSKIGNRDNPPFKLRQRYLSLWNNKDPENYSSNKNITYIGFTGKEEVFYADPQKKTNNNPDFQYLIIEV